MPVTLYDPQTGAPQSVTPEEAHKAIESKTLGPTADQKFSVRLKDGTNWDGLEGKDLHDAIAHGATIRDPEAEAHAKAVEGQKGIGGTLAATALGAADGLTAGGFNVAAHKVASAINPEYGERFKEGLAINKEANPYVYPAAQLGGAVLGALATGGASAEATAGSVAARALPAGAINVAGAAVERGVGGALARIGAGTTTKAISQTAARAGVESAAYSMGQYASEKELGDPKLAGEKYWVGLGLEGLKAAAGGAVIGGAFSGAGSLVKSLRGAASKGGSELLGEAAANGIAQAEEKLTAAEAAHAEATKRSFSYKDFQGSPVELDVAGGQATHAPEAEQAFTISKDKSGRSSINLGPSEGDAAYANPHAVDGIDGLGYDKTGQPRPVKAPSSKKAFDIGAYQPKVDPMSVGTRYDDPSQWAGPWEHDPSAVVMKSGIEAIEPYAAGEGPIGVSTNKETVAANERLRQGTVSKAHTVGLGDVEGGAPSASGRPVYVPEALEDPAVIARREATAADLATAEKDLATAHKEAAESKAIETAAAEVRKGDPHQIAANYAYDALGATKGLTTKIERFPGGKARVGATLLREGIIDVGAEGENGIKATVASLSRNTHEEMLTRTRAKLDTVGKQLSDIGGTNTSVTLKELLKPIDEQIAKYEAVGGTVPVANRLRGMRANILATPQLAKLLDVDGNLVKGALETKIPFADLIKERQAVQRAAYAVGDVHANYIKEVNGELSTAWGALEGEALDRAAAEGGPTGAQFKALKTTFTDLKNAEKALEGTVAGNAARLGHGLVDRITAHTGAVIGGAIVPVIGHAVGHVAGSIISKMARQRGSAAAAVAMTKIADIGAVKAMIGTVDSAVERAARGLTSTEAKAAKVRLPSGAAKVPKESDKDPLASRYRDTEEKLSQMESQQSRIHEHAMNVTQDLAQHAPNVANEYSTAVARSIAFLSSKRPVPLTPPDPFTNRAPSILEADKLSFIRSFKATTDPMSVLRDFERGVVTPEATEALRQTAPKVYEQLRSKAMEMIADGNAQGKPMPFKKRVQLGLLFDLDAAEPSIQKPVYQMLQGNVSTPPAPPTNTKGGKNKAPSRPVKLPNTSNPLDVFLTGKRSR